MKYSVKLGNPKPFYDESHRPAHFLNFANIDNAPAAVAGSIPAGQAQEKKEDLAGMDDIQAERDDLFA